MEERLDGHRVLITGAARGIGASIAERLVREGASVAINDLPGAGAEETAAVLDPDGARAIAVPGDVTRPDDVEAMIARAAERLGGLTGLVNNAGTLCRAQLEDFDDAEWARTLRVNLDSAYLCTKAFVKNTAGDRRAIVNIASMSYRGMTQQIAYVASKGGLVSLTRGAALELAKQGVRVNAVAPGMTETPMTAVEDGGTDSLRVAMLRQIPLRRYARPEEIASTVAFLVSDDASYITGETLHVAGGARL